MVESAIAQVRRSVPYQVGQVTYLLVVRVPPPCHKALSCLPSTHLIASYGSNLQGGGGGGNSIELRIELLKR